MIPEHSCIEVQNVEVLIGTEVERSSLMCIKYNYRVEGRNDSFVQIGNGYHSNQTINGVTVFVIADDTASRREQ